LLASRPLTGSWSVGPAKCEAVRVRPRDRNKEKPIREDFMRASTFLAGLALTALGLASSSAQPGSLMLGKEIVIIHRPHAAGPVKLAVEDLRNDFEKVLGTKPGVAPGPRNGIAVEVAAPTGGAPESFSIAVRGNHVVLSGADMRGTLYAIYSFSQEWLGVDP